MEIYSEVLNPATNQWECQQANSFNWLNTGNNGSVMPCMSPAVVARKLPKGTDRQRLHSVLVMANGSPEFAFPMRHLPSNASEHVLNMVDQRWQGCMNWRTRAELEAKLSDLIIIGTEQAFDVLGAYKRFLNALPDYSGDPDHQRFIFWF